MPEIKLTFDAADDYDRFMGRWSRAIGERFLAWFGAPRGARWLDVGCGTGAFSELILRQAAPAALTGIDPSPQQIDYVRKRLPAHTFEVADSAAMPFGDGAFNVIASALVLHFIPDRHKAFAEMKRVLASGALVGGYTWRRTAESDMAAYWPMMRGAEAVGGQALRSAVVPEGTQDGMRASLSAAGFTAIETTEIEVSQTYVSFDDYWEAQTRPSSPPGRTVAALDQRQRAKMRDQMRETMPAANGTVTYSSVAIAGKGRKP
jgi:ubiquinone/menaquinone biosynthesis C-methylase UbiE